MPLPLKKSNKFDTELPKTDELVQSIKDIGAGMRTLNASMLKREGLIVLLQHAVGSRVSRKDISEVLDALSDLERRYLKR